MLSPLHRMDLPSLPCESNMYITQNCSVVPAFALMTYQLTVCLRTMELLQHCCLKIQVMQKSCNALGLQVKGRQDWFYTCKTVTPLFSIHYRHFSTASFKILESILIALLRKLLLLDIEQISNLQKKAAISP